ncbi:hypothetical protein O6H91_14G056800 [Diphasiastrum complanatum]|uniref:Uncharacterized protein n=1 Tax=Diphasiastrum complanatum TaxID=34168 RepID=A0ACC2BPL9_DIPCM|nr:hypothetical protein O6H91_14G056800 [Diphasiastrum complanatum]
MAVGRDRLPVAATSAKNEVVKESAANIPQGGQKSRPPAPQNICPPLANKTAAECQQPPSTVLILIASMCVMLFLVAIAILLLFYSYFKHRLADSPDREEQRPGTTTAATNIEMEGGITPCLLVPEYSQPLFLVIMPGDEEPGFFARPCLLPNSTGRASALTESESIESRNDHSTELTSAASFY